MKTLLFVLFNLVSVAICNNQSYLTTENITISTGEKYNNWNVTGKYTRNLKSVSGCDSVVVTNLTVNTSPVVYDYGILPSNLNTNDKALYTQYLTYCNTIVSDTIKVVGYITDPVIKDVDITQNVVINSRTDYNQNRFKKYKNVPSTETRLTIYPVYVTINFVAPVFNGGAEILGYTVTSIPAGGVDENAGTKSTTHLISGLNSNISYQFTVVATNSVGNSAPSTPSNSIVPKSGKSYYWTKIVYPTLQRKSGLEDFNNWYCKSYYVTEDITIAKTENYNGWTISGKYNRTLKTKSDKDSIVVTNLIVK